MGMKPHRLELHISELVLRGFAPGDRYRIAEALQAELARRLAEQVAQGFPVTGNREIGRLGASLELTAGVPAEAVGAEAARVAWQRIHEGLASGEGSRDG